MKIKPLLIIAIAGILIGLISVYYYNQQPETQPPLAVSYNPYEKGVYATGIVESYQPHGSNVSIYPEVAGPVTKIFIKEGQTLRKGTPILAIDDLVQQALVKKDEAQIKVERANLVNVQQQLDKIKKSYCLDPKSVSQNVLDNAINAVKIAVENLKVAIGQYKQDKTLLDKYIVRTPIDGMVFQVQAAVGDYIAPQTGIYDTYTQGMQPVIQMGVVTPYMEVRCYLDEILVPRLPTAAKLQATMFIRGENNKAIPLKFVSIQPYTIPNIQLSDEKQERVDVRVLPIIFKFKRPTDVNVYPGQLVDIYIKGTK